MIDIASITSGLVQGGDGIWRGASTGNVSYPVDANDAYFSVEDSSFWFKHRNECVVTLVRTFPPSAENSIVDIGGGNGFVSQGLMKAGFDVALIEPGAAGAFNARKRGLRNVICATTTGANIRDRSVPAVGLFDVIEHIEDDLAFLGSIRAMLQHDGRVYITVPAHSALWSAEDENAGHYRRYTRRSLSRLLDSAGFDVLFSTYIFRLLPVPIALLRALPYRLFGAQRPKDGRDVARDHVIADGAVARLVGAALQGEVTSLARKRPLRFGASCMVVARVRASR